MSHYARLGVSIIATLLLLGLGRLAGATDAVVRVMPSTAENMYEVYEQNKERGVPTLITSDSILHTAHVLFDYTLRAVELQQFDTDLRMLTDGMALRMATLAQQQSENNKNTDISLALPPFGYDRVAAYFGVAQKLLDSQAKIPKIVRPLVEQEVGLILAHDQVAISPILGVTEDYTQYVPRGHYTRNEQFQRYFRAMMWYGRAGFPISGEKRPGVPLTEEETRANALAGIVLSRTMQSTGVSDPNPISSQVHYVMNLWEAIYRPTEFIVGQSDDLTPPEYVTLSQLIFGDKLPQVWKDAEKAQTDKFIAAAIKLRPAKILGGVQSDKEKQPPVTLRLMGQRFVPDSAIFQRLVYDQVPDRYLPSGLDVMAVLGSQQAEAVLRQRGEFTKYPQYGPQLAALREETAKTTPAEWNATAYRLWLYALHNLIADPNLTRLAKASDPSGMRTVHNLPDWWSSSAWQAKQLNAGLGSWAELRHDTILYTKQSYTVGMTAVMPTLGKAEIYVEPVPNVYSSIGTLMSELCHTLTMQRVFPPELKTNYDSFATLLRSLLIISYHETPQVNVSWLVEAPKEEDWARINDIGAILRGIETLPDPLRVQLTGDEDTHPALIADVHTDPNHQQVLEVGVGKVAMVIVPVKVDNTTFDAYGPIFTYYEFPQPLEKRLTDAEWQQMLDQRTAPSPLVIGGLLANR